MADIFDQTDERMEREQALRDKQRAIEAARPKAVSEFCIDCDERISDARQKATGGCDRCVPCLELEAVRRRHFR
tara:strand:+ start:19080 stop:19301 length:222 start_codon:yes stop_codon:yes gene_type:complete